MVALLPGIGLGIVAASLVGQAPPWSSASAATSASTFTSIVS